jgi:hypothetical protein
MASAIGGFKYPDHGFAWIRRLRDFRILLRHPSSITGDLSGHGVAIGGNRRRINLSSWLIHRNARSGKVGDLALQAEAVF